MSTPGTWPALLHIVKDRLASSRVALSSTDAATVGASWGDILEIHFGPNLSNSIFVVAEVFEAEQDTTPTFKIFQSSPSRQKAPIAGSLLVKVPQRLAQVFFGENTVEFETNGGPLIGLSKPQSFNCAIRAVGSSNQFTSCSRLTLRPVGNGIQETHLPSSESIQHLLDGVPLRSGSIIYVHSLSGPLLPFHVNMEPILAKITPQTSISFLPPDDSAPPTEEGASSLKTQSETAEKLAAIVNSVKMAVHRPYFIGLPRSVLLCGPSGSGKSTMVRSAIMDQHVAYLHYSPARIQSLMDDDPDAVSSIFDNAIRLSHVVPLVIVFDDIDVLLATDSVSNLSSKDRTEQLFMDGARRLISGSVSSCMVCTSNSANSLGVAVRRLFDSELTIGPLSPVDRRNALWSMLQHLPSNYIDQLTQYEIFGVADACAGFCLGDLAALCRLALSSVALSARSYISAEELKLLIGRVRPISVRNMTPSAEIPKVHWKDIGGLEHTKARLIDATSANLDAKKRALFARFGVRPPSGILLYGPPGTGKTLLAKAVAAESGANFVYANMSEILRSELGQSEAAIGALFSAARKAAPAIVFFDEFQALFGSKETSGHFGRSMIAQLVLEMDGLSSTSDVIVMAATNRPDFIDPSFLRPGRFDELVYVPPPDATSRREILRLQLAPLKLDGEAQTLLFLESLVSRTNSFSGADIKNLCFRAGMNAIERDPDNFTISVRDFEVALAEFGPSISPQVLQVYTEFNNR